MARDMRLKILACRQVYSGRNQRQDQYTIYEVDAARAEDGHRINEKLRSFQALPIGEVLDVTVTPFDSTRHGRSFTLSVKGSRGGGGSTQRANELREELELLRENLAKLAARVNALEAAGGPPVAVAPPAAPAPASTALDEKFGPEAPW